MVKFFYVVHRGHQTDHGGKRPKPAKICGYYRRKSNNGKPMANGEEKAQLRQYLCDLPKISRRAERSVRNRLVKNARPNNSVGRNHTISGNALYS